MHVPLRAELLHRSTRDQQARERWLANDGIWAEVKCTDKGNTSWLSGVIAEHGWPGQHNLVGVEAAHAAWLLAQHAPRAPGPLARSAS